MLYMWGIFKCSLLSGNNEMNEKLMGETNGRGESSFSRSRLAKTISRRCVQNIAYLFTQKLLILSRFRGCEVA